jgi:hypothetical protein
VESPSPGVLANPQGPSLGSRSALNVEKTGTWLRKLSEVLPVFITYHSAAIKVLRHELYKSVTFAPLLGAMDISQITDVKHYAARRACTEVVANLCCVMSSPGTSLPHRLALSDYGWFERVRLLCF